MKSIKKLIFVMAALAAVFGFVACSDDDDDGPSKVAVFESTPSMYTVTFYDNSSYEVVGDFGPGVGKKTAEKGTYTGKPKGEGEVTLTPKKVIKIDTSTGATSLVDATSEPYDLNVDSDGKCSITINGVMYSFSRK